MLKWENITRNDATSMPLRRQTSMMLWQQTAMPLWQEVAMSLWRQVALPLWSSCIFPYLLPKVNEVAHRLPCFGLQIDSCVFLVWKTFIFHCCWINVRLASPTSYMCCLSMNYFPSPWYFILHYSQFKHFLVNCILDCDSGTLHSL